MNVINFISIFLCWLIIILVVHKIAVKQNTSLKNWRLYVVVLIGLFSFDFVLSFFERNITITIFPLGVWVLYIFLHKKEETWLKYRSFAWLGFWSNYLFLVMSLISWPIHHWIYPTDDLTTYFSHTEEVKIVGIHPSAKEQGQPIGNLKKALTDFRLNNFYTDEWYNETYFNSDATKVKERFPYIVLEQQSKWGSGIESTIYLEKDGKGVLVSTSKKQYYFRSEHSIIKEGSDDE